MIYCVEDDKDIMQIMLYTLKSAGYEARGFENREEFWQGMKEDRPDLVMLDIMLPGEDGLSVLSKLRSGETTKDVYIIMTTAKGSEYDKVIGLDSGADFYLTKPFGMMEMIAHVKAVMRRGQKIINGEEITMGEIKLDISRHTVYVKGEKVFFTGKEFEILKVLLSNPGRVYSRDRLMEQVWGYDWTGESRTVDVHIGAIRTKLGQYSEYIETVRGFGYRADNKG